MPPGHRGTGAPWWFEPTHPATAPCCTCGAVTDRWYWGALTTGPDSRNPEGTPGLVLVAQWPICEACDATRVRAQLERIVANEAVLPRLRQDAQERLQVPVAA